MQVFHFVVETPTGTATFGFRGRDLDNALRRAQRAGHPTAEPMVGPQSRTYYRCQGC